VSNGQRILLIGPTGLDVVASAPGAVRQSGSPPVVVMLGGACRNTAYNLSLRGAQVTLLTQRYRHALRLYGIVSRPAPFREQFLPQAGADDSLCIYMAYVQNGTVCASTAHYDRAQEIFNLAAAHRARHLVRRYDAVVSCTDVAFGFWRSVVDAGPKNQFRCLLTSGFPLPEGYLKWLPGSDLLMINADEVQALGAEPMEFCAVALESGVRHVVITLGAEGAALCCTRGAPIQRRIAPPMGHPIASPVGAGDACAAGVIAALLKGSSLATAVDEGLTLAVAKLGYPGNTLQPGSLT
jgi:sugar/nucleoside kinase (ribokinase family)